MDRQKVLVYAGLAFAVAMALAVSLRDLQKTQDDPEFSRVVSEFIILSVGPDTGGFDLLSRQRTQRANRLQRLTHVQPEVLAAYASALGLKEADLRLQISNPYQTGPFDHTSVGFDSPDSFATGTAGRWSWARATQKGEIRAWGADKSAVCGQDTHCGVWLLYWDQDAWYYAPTGAAGLDAALITAVPELASALASGD